MGQFTYLAILAGVVAGSLWLELALRTHVLRRWRRLLIAVAPVLLVFLAWDAYAVAQGHWDFDPARVIGPALGDVPVEELLFFVVVPIAAVLTLEAVRAVTGWDVGEDDR